MVKLEINNKSIEVPEDTTILEAAKMNGILIPNLCYLKDVHKCGSCRICAVEVAGAKALQASCMTKVTEGMVISTNTEKVRKIRKVLYELLLSDHRKDCLSCNRNQHCELQRLGESIQVSDMRFEGERSKNVSEDNNPSIYRDMSKCILCRRCVTICNDIQGVGVLNAQNRGFKTEIGPCEAFELMDMNCTFCGQCTTVCPVGALNERDSTQKIWDALYDSKKHVIVQTAPAIRAALGEEFGYEPGTLVTGKMASALRLMGFNDVFDTNFTADLTILEEGTELLGRLRSFISGKKTSLPMITSCSPG